MMTISKQSLLCLFILQFVLEKIRDLEKAEEMDSKLYQIGLDRRADPQFVPFLLHFLDEVDEHVSLRQVLWGQDNYFKTFSI